VLRVISRLFGRRSSVTASTANATSPKPFQPPPAAKESGAGWRSLAAMPVAIRPSAPIVQTARFESSLVTRSRPTFLAPLVHDRGAQYVSGVIEGIATLTARPVATRASNPSPSAPARRPGTVQRFASRWRGLFGSRPDQVTTYPDAGPAEASAVGSVVPDLPVPLDLTDRFEQTTDIAFIEETKGLGPAGPGGPAGTTQASRPGTVGAEPEATTFSGPGTLLPLADVASPPDGASSASAAAKTASSPDAAVVFAPGPTPSGTPAPQQWPGLKPGVPQAVPLQSKTQSVQPAAPTTELVSAAEPAVAATESAAPAAEAAAAAPAALSDPSRRPAYPTQEGPTPIAPEEPFPPSPGASTRPVTDRRAFRLRIGAPASGRPEEKDGGFGVAQALRVPGDGSTHEPPGPAIVTVTPPLPTPVEPGSRVTAPRVEPSSSEWSARPGDPAASPPAPAMGAGVPAPRAQPTGTAPTFGGAKAIVSDGLEPFDETVAPKAPDTSGPDVPASSASAVATATEPAAMELATTGPDRLPEQDGAPTSLGDLRPGPGRGDTTPTLLARPILQAKSGLGPAQGGPPEADERQAATFNAPYRRVASETGAPETGAPERGVPSVPAAFSSAVGGPPEQALVSGGAPVPEMADTRVEGHIPLPGAADFTPKSAAPGVGTDDPPGVRRAEVRPWPASPSDASVIRSGSMPSSPLVLRAPLVDPGTPEHALVGPDLRLQRQTAGRKDDVPRTTMGQVAPRVEPGKSYETSGSFETALLVGQRMPDLLQRQVTFARLRNETVVTEGGFSTPATGRRFQEAALAAARLPSSAPRPGSKEADALGSRPLRNLPGSVGPAQLPSPGDMERWPQIDLARPPDTLGGWATAPAGDPAPGGSYSVMAAGGSALQRLAGAAPGAARPVPSVPPLVHRSPSPPATAEMDNSSHRFIASFSPAPAPASGRLAEPEPVGGMSNTVQRAVEAGTGEPASVESSSPNAPMPKTDPGGTDIDDLSRRLYERIRDRLKAELYLDRERAGQLSDFTV
jgi:hypothetical protein